MEKDKEKEKEALRLRSLRQSSGQAEQAWWQPAIMMFARMSVWIAVPVLLAVFLGKWLDKKYDTEPILLLVTVGLAFLFSMFGLYKNAVEEYKKIEQDGKKSKNKNK